MKATHLKMEIVRRGLIQADLARAAGIGESRLSRIVSGRAPAHDHEVAALARVLRMAKEELRL